MLCPSCGSTLPDGAKFCGACGAKLASADQGPAVSEAAAQPAAAPSGASEVSSSASATVPAAQAAVPVPPVGASAGQKGVLGQAWSDITSSPGWVKRMLLLMVMNVVPVLNCFVSGYLLQWGADASRGVNPSLPKQAFDLRGFLTGLFYCLLSVLMVVGMAWTGILAVIPILGWIVMALLPFFANAFLAKAGMRMAIFSRLGAAFDLSVLFAKYKKHLGPLFAATFVPNLIVVIVVCTLLGILFIGGCAAGSSMLSAGMYGSSRSSSMALEGLMLGAGVGVIFFVVICLFAVCFAAFAQAWSLRAVGIWAARVAPEWQEQAAQEQEGAAKAAGAPAAKAAGPVADR